ncbi:hypothetical protein V9Y44_23670, partial [Klebsiella pneumoniae]|uniref:hypothetical protein n=1 Tax=Klebsiella pneumoniae TaxID=573 RepID=UPI0031323FA3
MGSCAAPSAKGDDKFITTDYLQQCRLGCFFLHAIHILCSVLMFPSEVTLLCFVVGGEAKTLSSVSPASNRAYSL